DDFKDINDDHGHQAGDDILRCVARGLAAALRLNDPCFRYGGDEFVAILLDADLTTARTVATRVQRTVGLACRTPAGAPVRLTVGVAELVAGETGADLFARADAQLLATKAARRQAR